MPSFDVVSELDMQEVRNAVDQAHRELATRFDFKDTGSSVDLGKDDLTLKSSTEDRIKAVRQVLEEKFVKRKVSLKALDYQKIEEAFGLLVLFLFLFLLKVGLYVGPTVRDPQA